MSLNLSKDSQALTSVLEATTAQDLGEGLGGVCAGVRWPGMSQNPSKGCGTVGDPSRWLFWNDPGG